MANIASFFNKTISTGEPDFSHATYLVIDSVAEMRKALEMTLSSIGANKVEFASRATDAIARIQRADFDVILSDITLDKPLDGMFLLEELKNRNLLKPSAVFMIVTSEAHAQNVISAAELAPDDYLLKPFTGEALLKRLERSYAKKQAFRVVDHAILQHDYLLALAECNHRIDDKDPYLLDFMKMKGKLCLLTGDAVEAKRTYQQLLDIRPFGWAKMGYGKALFQQRNYEEAQKVFEELISENRYAMEAYDWLAHCQEARDDALSAQDTLQKAVNLSPSIIHRLRHFGSVAVSNHDWEKVSKAFTSCVDYGKYTFHHNPMDYAHLSHAQIAQGDIVAAEKTVFQVKKAFQTPEAAILAKTMDCKLLIEKKQLLEAEALLADALKAYDQLGGQIPADIQVELAGSCYQLNQPDAARQIAEQVIKNQSDEPHIARHLQNMFQAVGKIEEGEQLIAENNRDFVEKNNIAVNMAKGGDLEGAVQHFLSVLSERPNNLSIMLNTINAILAYVNHNGWHEHYMMLAADYLEHIRTQHPTNGKCQKLMALYRSLKFKNRIQEEA